MSQPVDVSTLTPEAQATYAKYGQLPRKGPGLLGARPKKTFDSADHFMLKDQLKGAVLAGNAPSPSDPASSEPAAPAPAPST